MFTTSPEGPAVSPDQTGHPDDSLNTKHMRKVLASSFIGSVIEYYDFLLYATAAALVFGPVFFSNLSPAMATFASFGTLAVGYLARPLGGAVFGHFGDRVGRKKVLVISMLTMGIATTCIGLLPPTAQIGVAAPILMIVLRMVQGVAVGGEWGGAMLVALEHSPAKRRGFAASFANMGAPVGTMLATLAVSAATLLPDDDFLRWGWRIPFLASILLVVVGLAIRLAVTETPLFQQLEEDHRTRKLPLWDVITNYPRNLLLGTLAGISIWSTAGMVTVWGVTHVVEAGADKTGVLNAKALAAVGALITVYVGARLSDRYGRRPVMIVGAATGAVLALPLLMLLDAGTVMTYAIAVMVGQLIQGLIFGPFAAFTAELFPTHVRYTGASVAFQTASTIGAGCTPAIAAGLMVATGGNITVVAGAWIATFVVSLIAILLVSEGRNQDIESNEGYR